MIVIDASALVELLLGTPRGAAVATRVAHATTTLHAPHVIDLEITSALRTLESQRVITTADATQAVSDLLAADLTRYPHDPLLAAIWKLRGNVTPYDAAYLSLAAHLQAPLLTCDAQLARSPRRIARVELIT